LFTKKQGISTRTGWFSKYQSFYKLKFILKVTFSNQLYSYFFFKLTAVFSKSPYKENKKFISRKAHFLNGYNQPHPSFNDQHIFLAKMIAGLQPQETSSPKGHAKIIKFYKKKHIFFKKHLNQNFNFIVTTA
jgi:hypothetical protein